MTNNTNKTTEYTYDGDGHTLTVKADLPSSAYETTQFVYGVTTAGGSAVNSNDVLAATEYPDPSSGNPSTSSEETYTVNALGQNVTATDRNGNVHTYTYDVLGRQTSDAVTTLGQRRGRGGAPHRHGLRHAGQRLPGHQLRRRQRAATSSTRWRTSSTAWAS